MIFWPPIALHVTTDSLVFAEHERGPADDLKLAFEAITDLDPAEQAMVTQLIEAVLLKHQAKRGQPATSNIVMHRCAVERYSGQNRRKRTGER